MSQRLLTERIKVMRGNYQQIFAERGDVTPNDELEFHLYHLARYWGRLIGFCRNDSDQVTKFVESDLGACIAVGSEFLNQLIGPGRPTLDCWEEAWRQTQSVLFQRPVTFTDIQLAAKTFEDCLSEAQFDPWK